MKTFKQKIGILEEKSKAEAGLQKLVDKFGITEVFKAWHDVAEKENLQFKGSLQQKI